MLLQYQSQTQLGFVHVLSVPSTEYVHYRDYYCNRQKDQSLKHSLKFTWGVTRMFSANVLLTEIPKASGADIELWNLHFQGMGLYHQDLQWKLHWAEHVAGHRPQNILIEPSFSPKISANTMEAIKYLKHTAQRINKASCQRTDQQISWKYSKYISVFKPFPFLLKRYHILFFT